MKNRNKILLSALISLFMTPAFALPSVTVLATGGTIAGAGNRRFRPVTRPEKWASVR